MLLFRVLRNSQLLLRNSEVRMMGKSELNLLTTDFWLLTTFYAKSVIPHESLSFSMSSAKKTDLLNSYLATSFKYCKRLTRKSYVIY